MTPTNRQHYSLFTAITMIVGIVVGSGIFFKSDNILIATGGSVLLGCLAFVIAAIAIIFGGLCLGQLARLTDKPGGVITYAEEFTGPGAACVIGWFEVFAHYPTLIVVVAWVVGIYVCTLFGWPATLELQISIGFLLCSGSFLLNALSAKAGGLFQNAATIIKMIPLLFLAILGLAFGDPIAGFQNLSPHTLQGISWLTAVSPIVFAYDGWIVSTSIAHEIKNSKRNLPLALIISPLLVLSLYLLYFVGITSYVGPAETMALGDDHLYVAAGQLLGEWGGKIVLIFVIISALGTVNGVTLGFIRLPYLLGLRRMLPGSTRLTHLKLRTEMPVYAAVFAYIITTIWFAVHYLASKYDWLPNSDISEIAIVTSYLMYILFYFQVFQLYRQGRIQGAWSGCVVPILATIGSLVIFGGGIHSASFLVQVAYCVLVCFLAYWYYKKHLASDSKVS